MTKTEIEARTQEKVAKVKALCAELQVSLSAQEVIIPNSGIITKVVYFQDDEKYPVDEEPKDATDTPVQE